MTQPQQTIGNTVYCVGQEIFCNSEDKYKELQLLAEKGVKLKQIAGGITGMMFKITALPNPDPVAEDWREVVLAKFRKPRRLEKQDDYINEAVEFIEQGRLQIAMQEVCKADEVKLEYPKDYFDRPIYCHVKPGPLRDVQDIALCFLLGGRVFVKGGV